MKFYQFTLGNDYIGSKKASGFVANFAIPLNPHDSACSKSNYRIASSKPTETLKPTHTLRDFLIHVQTLTQAKSRSLAQSVFGARPSGVE